MFLLNNEINITANPDTNKTNKSINELLIPYACASDIFRLEIVEEILI